MLIKLSIWRRTEGRGGRLSREGSRKERKPKFLVEQKVATNSARFLAFNILFIFFFIFFQHFSASQSFNIFCRFCFFYAYLFAYCWFVAVSVFIVVVVVRIDWTVPLFWRLCMRLVYLSVSLRVLCVFVCGWAYFTVFFNFIDTNDLKQQ